MTSYFKDDQNDYGDKTSGGLLDRIFLYQQAFSDKLQFYKTHRWISVGVMAVLFMIRLFITKGKKIILNKFPFRLPCTYLLPWNPST